MDKEKNILVRREMYLTELKLSLTTLFELANKYHFFYLLLISLFSICFEFASYLGLREVDLSSVHHKNIHFQSICDRK